ncbi:MAG: HAMP domain-containing sensor histidine kinase [Solirubrobacterales bacterium]
MSGPAGSRAGLRGRLALSIAALVVAALSVTFVAVYRTVGSELRSQIDRDLARQADALTARLRAVPPKPGRLLAASATYVRTQSFGSSPGLILVTVPGAGTVSNQPELLGRALEPGESHRAAEHERNEGEELRSSPPGYSEVEISDAGGVRVLTRPVRGAGPGPLAVVRVGEQLEPVERAQAEVSRAFVLIGALTLVAALAAGYLLAARTAAPLRRMARVAAEVDAGDLEARIGSEGPRDEVRTLAEAFDHMLDRLEDAFARQRGFVSDASHELRTPLTAVRGQLEVLARDPAPSAERVRETERVVIREIDRMSRLVDDLLSLARLDEGAVLTTERVELGALLGDLVDLARDPAGARIELGEVAGGTVLADPDRIAQVVRNLMANAAGHAGAAGRVLVSARPQGGGVEIAVDDDGPGIPPAERERFCDRFHRSDAARARRRGPLDSGSGLGLAIARSIVEAHGGSIRAAQSPLGGARVSFILPGYEAEA